MTTTSNATLVLSKGELYFSRFIGESFVGEGERYLGNTPGFTISRKVEKVDRYTSYGGQRVPVEAVVTQQVHSAKITTDNFDEENIALWMSGEPDKTGQIPIGVITENITVKRGRYYQLGLTYSPIGVRHVDFTITFAIDGFPLNVTDNLGVDLTEGRFFVLDDAPDVVDGAVIETQFQWRRSDSVAMVPTPQEVRGSLRFVPKNAVGPGLTYVFPYVVMEAAGEIDLKANQWLEIDLNVEIRKLAPSIPYFYALQPAGADYTADELAILEIAKMELSAFQPFENNLDIIINLSIPDADYGQVITYP